LKQHWVFILLWYHVVSSVSLVWPTAFSVIVGTNILDTNMKTRETHKWNTKNRTSLDRESRITNYFSFTPFHNGQTI